MRRFVLFILFCFSVFNVSQASAEELILVIDPHGHSSQISKIMFTPDSQHVVIGNGNKAEVYTVPKLKKKLRFTKHVSPITNNAFSNSVTAIAFYRILFKYLS